MDWSSVQWRWAGRGFKGCIPQGLDGGLAEGWRGAGLIPSSKGEASQSEDNVVEMGKEVMGPPQHEIANGLATPFLGRREGDTGVSRGPFSTLCSVLGSPCGGLHPSPPPRCCVISPALTEPHFHPSPSHRQGSVP